MFPYLLISAVAVYILVKWLVFRWSSRRNPSQQELDLKLLKMLNPGRDMEDER
ncbi:hypothetical protein [Gorillibacterium massiliense]|uniref:hypothetical protein n=1 Tax=Gorillibacterium massiliense TaxID=1280390 RepID=UPI0004B0167A|nr:hypothetical protein [Gorillibacterium massiliense]